MKPRKMKWAGHVVNIEDKNNSYRILVGKPEGKRSLGRPRRGWENNFIETGWGVMDWINLAQDKDQRKALLNITINTRVK
jgi:hypothetical protein